MLDTCVEYVSSHGLRFNPSKTTCFILGNNPFTSSPNWNINNVTLAISNEIKYLGTDIGSLTGTTLCDSRVSASTRAFYSLQGAGLKCPEITPEVTLDLFSTCINSVLKYGYATVYCTKKNMDKLDKVQSKLIKQCLGLKICRRTSPLLKAINILPASLSVQLDSLDLLKNCILNNSVARNFYCYLLNERRYKVSKTLVDRSNIFCQSNNVNLIKYIFSHDYMLKVKKITKEPYYNKPGTDGIIDTIRALLNDNYDITSNQLMNLLLKTF